MISDPELKEHLIEIKNEISLFEEGGDLNLEDIIFIAQSLYLRHLTKEFPRNLPDKETGIAIAESVEDIFIRGVLVRNLSKEEFLSRAGELIKRLQTKNLLNVGAADALALAFFTWHGCINMAKATRVKDVLGNLYTPEMRNEAYSQLKQEWEDEERKGNLWVKYGVSLAKLLEEKRKKQDPQKQIMDDWVPTDSPYWKYWRYQRKTNTGC